MRAKSDGPGYSELGPHLFPSLSLSLPLSPRPHLVLLLLPSSVDCCWPRRPRDEWPAREDDDDFRLRSPSAATGFGGKLAGNVRGFRVGGGATSRGRSHDAGIVSDVTLVRLSSGEVGMWRSSPEFSFRPSRGGAREVLSVCLCGIRS